MGASGEVTAGAEHLHAVLPHGRQVRSTGDEMDVGARVVERGTDVGADRSGAEDCDFHGNTPFGLRDTAEVTAVRLMSTKYCLQYGGWVDKGCAP
ncbi:hypothetical protein GCM10010254_28730 [Streptomyces chromofuscus]|nr:hypothetical protein GCM10010254_28730 [Streptomyces chromofuscus]